MIGKSGNFIDNRAYGTPRKNDPYKTQTTMLRRATPAATLLDSIILCKSLLHITYAKNPTLGKSCPKTVLASTFSQLFKISE
jgi:hypothetical protein